MKNKNFLIIVCCFSFFCSVTVYAEESLSKEEMMLKKKMMVGEASEGKPKLDEKYCLVDDSLGAGGYDLVSYFVGDRVPVKGETSLTHQHDNITYRFSSKENLARFEKNPEKYLPQYGGWCAMSLALGHKLCPDYDNFKIEGGKLYIFETTAFTNGQILWNKNPSENRKKAESEYQMLIGL